jgi:hypothetical protein
MKRILSCAVLLRLYVLIMSALYGWAMIFQPETLIYRIANATDFSSFAAYAMVIFAALGLVDVFVNDILPEGFRLLRALHDRHLVSMGLSVCFGIQLFTTVKCELPYAAMPFFAVYALLIPVSAFVDVQKRYKNKEMKNAT